MHVVLVNPLIPGNTGSAGRACLGFGAALHLIHPLGFELSNARVKRAGLDYWPHVDVREHASWTEFTHDVLPKLSRKPPYFVTKFAPRLLEDTDFFGDAECESDPTVLVFGSETKGVLHLLGEDEIARLGNRMVRLYMHADSETSGIRSFNLSTSVSMLLFEVHRQRHAHTARNTAPNQTL